MAQSTTAPPFAPTVLQFSSCPSNCSINNLTDNLLNEILCRLPCRFIHHHCRTSDHHHPLPFTLVLRFSYFYDNYRDDSEGEIHPKIHVVSENTAFQSNSFCLNFLPCFQSNIPKYLNQRNTLVGFVLDGCADAQAEYCSVNVASAQFEYKLVCISDTGLGLAKRQSSASAWIFSSVIGEWSKSEINGQAILVYDPDSNNQFRSIVLPTSLRTTNGRRLGVCQEHLCVTQLKPKQHGDFVTVWKLQDYNNNINNMGTWCLEFKACLGEMVTVDSSGPFWYTPELLTLHPYDGGVMYLRHRNHVYVCNLQTRMLKMVTNEIVDQRVLPLVHPCWPMPVPSARSNSISPAN
ncbi:hypothetical protein Ancab_007816 [Ancistrocladus abbreviatus]